MPVVATQLATTGIIVRQAVLPNVAGGSFDPNQAGAFQSGIKPATEAASYAPDTLEAADPAKKADDHGRVSAAEQREHQQESRPAPDTGTGPHHRGPRSRGET
jgi:hypothetical protein